MKCNHYTKLINIFFCFSGAWPLPLVSQIIHGKRTDVSQWKIRSGGGVFCPECGNKSFGKTKVKGHMEAVHVGEKSQRDLDKAIQDKRKVNEGLTIARRLNKDQV